MEVECFKAARFGWIAVFVNIEVEILGFTTIIRWAGGEGEVRMCVEGIRWRGGGGEWMDRWAAEHGFR